VYGKLITDVQDLNVQYDHDALDALVVRKKEEIEVKVPTVPTSDLETRRAVIFCGALLHRPHHAVRQQISKIHSDVYISGRIRGSPAAAYGLSPTNFITEVNNVPTPNLDVFLEQTKKIPDNTYFRLKLMSFDNVPWVATMKKNEHYFPTLDFVKSDELEKYSNTAGWTWSTHDVDKGGVDGMMIEGNEVIDASGEDVGGGNEPMEPLETKD
jgi:hypothetical protein